MSRVVTTTTYVGLGAHVWEASGLLPGEDETPERRRHGFVTDRLATCDPWTSEVVQSVEVWLLPELPQPKKGEYFRYTPTFDKHVLRVDRLDPSLTTPATHTTRLDFFLRVCCYLTFARPANTVCAAYTRTALEILGAG